MPTSRKVLFSVALASCVGLVAFWILSAAHWQAEAAHAKEPKPPEPRSAVSASGLGTWRVDLLDLAFKAASKMPVQPHIKNRSRAQESVVDACLRLDQPELARAQIPSIGDWRRGAAYADLAFWTAQHDKSADVQHDLDQAEEIATRAEKDGAQDWQRDRIRVKIARTHVLLGQSKQAARFEDGALPAEVGKVAAVEAMVGGVEVFDQRIRALEGAVAIGDFDQTQNALEACAQLYDSVYSDAERRDRLEEKIKSSWNKMPLQLRLDTLMQMSEFAARHEDAKKSLQLLDEAQTIFESAPWLPQDRVPLMARLAMMRQRCGDTAKARAQIDAAVELYDASRDKIVDIYRAQALRPVAEAYQSIGDPAAAVAMAKRVVEEGVANPNSRPRADDVCATCVSMAVNGIEPDAELRARLEQIVEELGAPW
jgi:tetratricopeptide (TPR) repeat protein